MKNKKNIFSRRDEIGSRKDKIGYEYLFVQFTFLRNKIQSIEDLRTILA